MFYQKEQTVHFCAIPPFQAYLEGALLHKISRKGSEFCDTCTILKNSMQSLSDQEERSILQNTLNILLLDVNSERMYLEKLRERSRGSNTDELQLTNDFAGKVLLPSLIR